MFKGYTKGIHHWACHATIQTQGCCPHPPHSHKEEELLLLLEGELDVIVPDVETATGDGRMHVGPGQVAYYPSFFAHTVETTSEKPAQYLVLRWFNRRRTHLPRSKGFGVFDIAFAEGVAEGFVSSLIFKEPTLYLRQLRCHTTVITPGQGQHTHVDKYEVVIVVMTGEVESLGERARPYDVLLYAAGEPHGMRNTGPETARLAVFELHGLNAGIVTRAYYAGRSRLARAARRVGLSSDRGVGGSG